VTIDEALDDFRAAWVDAQPITPRTAYGRTLRLLRFHLEREGLDAAEPLDRLRAAHLSGFVAWHAATGMADDGDGTRKVALHVARLGAHLAARWGRPDLDVGRERLRATAG
jgi:hypothetical protein